MRRDHLLRQIMSEQIIVTGIWKDSLFPAFKDLVRYGAERMNEGDNRKSIVDAAVDTAAATLSVLVPELLPYI